MSRITYSVPVVILAALVGVVAGTVAHEAGHAAACLSTGSSLTEVAVWPGVRLYPHVQRIPWEGDFGYVVHTFPDARWKRAATLFMGSGSTAALSYVLLALSAVRRLPRPARLFVGVVAVVFAWDLIGYAVLPSLGLRHAILIGGDTPEPLEAADVLHKSRAYVWAAVTVHALIFHALLTWRLRKRPPAAAIPPAPAVPAA